MLKNKLDVKNDKGSALVLAIVILAAVTALGVTMITLSTNQLEMASNLKLKEIARFNCDSCLVTVSKLVQHIVNESNQGNIGIAAGTALAPGIRYAAPVTAASEEVEFAQRVLFGLETQGCEDVFFDAQTIAAAVSAASGGTLTIAPTELDAAADIRAKTVGPEAGFASLEFAAGQGHGQGEGGASGGGMVLKFLIACRGQAPNNALHVGYSVYRKFLK